MSRNCSFYRLKVSNTILTIVKQKQLEKSSTKLIFDAFALPSNKPIALRVFFGT